ncbi:MAG: ATP-binding protein [bacterium]|nr:ATP-binding protein [bacterium]
MKRLPIGISDFKKLREGNYIYVDKTRYIYDLVNNSVYIFLSRPRRFGKSLLLSTIEYLYESKKELFKGLYIEDKWDWNEKYPVVKIDFSVDIKEYKEIYARMKEELELNYTKYEIEMDKEKDIPGNFKKLIIQLNKKYNKQVVVLIDEYDKPILDLIEDKKQAEEVRKILKSFYSVLKGLDKYIKFVIVTGVSKFAKVSLFSGLNQLKDISLDKRYGDICGYTQNELEYYFKEYLKDVNLEEVKEWYNGYNFLGSKVYNPFDILLYLDKKEKRNYWYETGRTEFLFKIIKQKNFDLPYLHKKYYTSEILEKFDIEYISIEALMFQTGYLTIKEEYKYENEEVLYSLDYPNKEVRKSFNSEILFYITGDYQIDKTTLIGLAFKKEEIEEIKRQIEVFISTISYEVLKNEYVYSAAIYGLVYSTGYNVVIEDNTSKGRIDLTIVVDKRVVYIVEFKMIEKEEEKGKAIKQIKEKEYHKKYLNYEKIYLLGIEFDKISKNLVNFQYELLIT